MTPSQDIDDMSRRTLGDGVPPEVAERLRGHLAAFEVALSARRRAERHSVRRLVLRTAAIAAALLLVGVLAPMLSRPTPTWANVVEQFDAAPFVNAAVERRELQPLVEIFERLRVGYAVDEVP